MITLRDYQQTAIDALRAAYRDGAKAPLLVMPTGAGKTVCFSYIAMQSAAKALRVLLLAHRRELINQISRALWSFDVRHGMIAPDFEETTLSVQVASIPTLIRRWYPGKYRFDLVVIDEAHHAVSGSGLATILEGLPDARRLGVTATPCRLDGRGLGVAANGFFDALVEGPTVLELIERGYLARPVVYAPPEGQGPDLRGVKVVAGDYAPGQLEKVMDTSPLTGDAVGHYRRLCSGQPAIAFCVTVEHAEHVAAEFRAAGYRAAALSGQTPDGLRQTLIDDLGKGRLNVLTSCNVVSEGTDIPVVSAAILLRPTASYALAMQQMGRVLRIHPGKEKCIAEGQLVLTDHGLVEIENVTLNMLVWDGDNFVSHQGAICRGTKRVITYAGLTATEDHLVFTECGWQNFGECERNKSGITTTGFGKFPIWKRRNLFSGGVSNKWKAFCSYTMRFLFAYVDHFIMQFEAWKNCGLSCLQPAGSGYQMAVSTNARRGTTLQQSCISRMEKLWSAWNKIQFRLCFNSHSVGTKQSRCFSGETDRSYRQRWTLRSWKSSLVNQLSKYVSYKKETIACSGSFIQNELPGSELCGPNLAQNDRLRTVRSRNHRAMDDAILQTERRVWDILEAGPFHRFTVSGLLVHNCLILDHAGNTRRHGLPTEPGDWTLSDRPKKPRHADLPDLTKDCPQCAVVLARNARVCPECGHEFAPVVLPQARAGELEEIDAVEAARAKRQEVAQARSLEELQAIGRQRGYRAGWAWHVWKERQRGAEREWMYG